MLAAALGRDVGDGALDDLEQRLLHALARDVAGDRDVFALAGDLVDLVDVDDPPFRQRDVVAGVLNELEEDVLHVLADVAGLGQSGGVGHGKGHAQLAGEGARQQRLAGPRGPDQQDVRLFHLHVAVALTLARDPLVVVVNRHRHHALGAFLADDVLVQKALDLLGRRQVVEELPRDHVLFFVEDLLADGDALVADVDARPGDQPAGHVGAFSAEGASLLGFTFCHCPRRASARAPRLPGRTLWPLRQTEMYRARDLPQSSPRPGPCGSRSS